MAGLKDTIEVVRKFSYPWSQAFWNLKLLPEGAITSLSLVAHLTPLLGVEIDAPTKSRVRVRPNLGMARVAAHVSYALRM